MSRYLLIAITIFPLMASAFAAAEPPSGVRELKPKDRSPKSLLVSETTSVENPVVGEKAPTGVPPPNAKILKVPPTDDFKITGDGSSPAWKTTSWEPLDKRPGAGPAHQSRFKMLYSPTGLYVLFQGADRKLTATIEKDFADLWNEDAFEFFLWPDQRQTVYFEYEISPLNRELALLVPNFNGRQLGWRPWHYEGPRKTRKATSVSGGIAKPGAEISAWSAEVFVPYALLSPLGNVPPRPHARWRANFYRVDYDGGQATAWDWSRVGPSFHEFNKFGVLEFQ